MFKNLSKSIFVALVGVFAIAQILDVIAPGSAFAKPSEKFSLIQTAELKKWMNDKTIKLAILDANSSETREKSGTIPGATLLSSYNHYDIAKELPADKTTKLVFYCANTRCTASHTAAERAVEAGYTNVSVFSDGIQGWAANGESVENRHS